MYSDARGSSSGKSLYSRSARSRTYSVMPKHGRVSVTSPFLCADSLNNLSKIVTVIAPVSC